MCALSRACSALRSISGRPSRVVRSIVGRDGPIASIVCVVGERGVAHCGQKRKLGWQISPHEQHRGPHERRRRVAIAGQLGQRAPDDRVELHRRRQVRPRVGDGRDVALELAREDVDGVAAGERRVACQQLVQHDADGVDVGGEGRQRAADDLGRHVLGRAGDPLLGAARRVDHAGDAEVDQLDQVGAGAPLVDDDVVALEVGVDHAGQVRLLDAEQDLGDDVERGGRRDRVLAADQLRERGPAQVLHGQVQQAVGRGAVVDDRDDVGVVEARRRHGLVAEPAAEALVAGEVVLEDLHRHAAPERHLLGAVHRAGAAEPDARGQAKLFGQLAPDHLLGAGNVVLDAHGRARGWRGSPRVGRADAGEDHRDRRRPAS
jgi:hypothetical protein